MLQNTRSKRHILGTHSNSKNVQYLSRCSFPLQFPAAPKIRNYDHPILSTPLSKYFIHHIVCGVKQESFLSFFKTREAVFDEDMERKENLSSGAKGDVYFFKKEW